jgi:hypothetical protein
MLSQAPVAAAELCSKLEKLCLFETTGYITTGVSRFIASCQRLCLMSVKEGS